MLLAIDIGNTSITAGLFDNDNLIKKISFKHNKINIIDFYEEKILSLGYNITDCVICSVVTELTEVLANSVKNLFKIKPLIVSSDINLGIQILAKYPEKIGADRIANCCAANALYERPAIVVDMGTATTFDIINEEGNFIGGIIIPGVETQIHSLFSGTSQLPDINFQSIKDVENTINNETEKAILAGVIKGHAYAIEELLDDCIKELKQKPLVILTGGYAELISHYFKKKSFDLIRQNLTLEGLNFVYKLNKQQVCIIK